MLKDSDIIENSSKREQYKVSRTSDDKWTKCKYLGSLLDSTKEEGFWH